MSNIPKVVRITLRVQPDTRGLDRSLTVLEQLATAPTLWLQILRQAVAETLLAAYRKRFLDNYEKVLDPKLGNGKGVTLAATSQGETAKRELKAAYGSLQEAQKRGDPASIVAAAQKLARAEQRLVTHTARAGSGELSTGQFRELALQVLHTMTDSSLVDEHVAGDAVTVGIGRLRELAAAETPSATPKLAGQPTASRFKTLWKQVEFGTGVYAKMPGVGARSPLGWWYGPRQGQGLHVLGAHGVHAVFDAATGLPYERDALRFEEVLAGLLGRALAGG